VPEIMDAAPASAEPVSGGAIRIRSLAVLPLANRSGTRHRSSSSTA
jgi:hypothetical protein